MLYFIYINLILSVKLIQDKTPNYLIYVTAVAYMDNSFWIYTVFCKATIWYYIGRYTICNCVVYQ